MDYDITKWGLPREYVTCPSCNQLYGHHRTKVCVECQECSKCCKCKTPKLKPMSQELLMNELQP